MLASQCAVCSVQCAVCSVAAVQMACGRLKPPVCCAACSKYGSADDDDHALPELEDSTGFFTIIVSAVGMSGQVGR